MPNVVCSIAATDNSGHAGLFNDLRVFADLGLHGTAVVSGITAQNSIAVLESSPASTTTMQSQWRALVEDLHLKAVKIGVLFNAEQLSGVRRWITDSDYPVVWDPVYASSVGELLKQEESAGIRSVILEMLPLCTVFTPNIPEAEWLLQRRIISSEDIILAAKDIVAMGAKSVLIKGGHSGESSSRVEDHFCSEDLSFWLSQPRQASTNNRGTGCMLSSAIAAFIAHGKQTADAVVLANAYVSQGMSKGFPIGSGNGVLANTGWPLQFDFFPAVSAKPCFKAPEAFAACSPRHGGLYPVVDTVDWVEKLLEAGVRTLQIRMKNKSGSELDSAIAQTAALSRRYQAQIYINDYWQLAIKHQAYGVHLGQEDLDTADLECIRQAGLRLGISTHSEYEWARAAAFRPSYIALGSVFPTNTKPVEVIGLGNLHRWVKTLKPAFALTAIGGITRENLDDILASGVESVAVVSAVTQASDYVAACRAFSQRLQQGAREYRV